MLERAGKEIHFSMANGTFKMKMCIDRQGPRLMANNCKNPNPFYFSLPSTFKYSLYCMHQNALLKTQGTFLLDLRSRRDRAPRSGMFGEHCCAYGYCRWTWSTEFILYPLRSSRHKQRCRKTLYKA